MYTNKFIKGTQFDTPSIVVGNLSVGGTGKTPQVEYLIRLLQEKYHVAVLSRGYKRKSSGFIIAYDSVTPDMIGDEPFQYFKKFQGIIVSVDANRVNGIKQLLQLPLKPDVVLLDDAFQHRKVRGGCTILLTSYNDLYVDDLLLPTGNLREGVSGAKRAQIIIVTKCPYNMSKEDRHEITVKLKPETYQKVFFTTIDYEQQIKGSSTIQLSELKNREVLLVTGIANPGPLIDYLNTRQVNFKHLKFPDHHNFSKRDIDEIKRTFKTFQSNNKIILTTEKDYVRIFGRLKKLHYISIKSEFIDGKNAFDNFINNYVEQNSGNG